MCAQFIIKAKAKQLSLKYGIEIPEDFEIFSRVVPYQNALVVTQEDARRKLKEMRFSLVPSWSKEPKVKFATHNARIETLIEKPTWKKPLQSHRCLVPLTDFIEPIYEHELAGNMVKFFRPDHDLLTAAGIFDVWTNKETGEVIESFSIVTTDPPDFVFKTGHDRCPVFLKPSAFDQWLDPKEKNPENLINLMKTSIEKMDLTVEIDRPLKAGWEKRHSL